MLDHTASALFYELKTKKFIDVFEKSSIYANQFEWRFALYNKNFTYKYERFDIGDLLDIVKIVSKVDFEKDTEKLCKKGESFQGMIILMAILVEKSSLILS